MLDKFISYQFSVLDYVDSYCRNNRIDTVVQLGDMFDDRKELDIRVLQKLHECSFLINSNVFIAGNHDVYYKNTNEVNAYRSMLCFPFGHVEYNMKKFVLTSPIEMDDVLYVPWITDDNRQLCMDAIESSLCSYCCGHFEIDGFEMTKGIKHDSGHLSLKNFKHFKRVYSGHFHLRKEQGNVVYVGTPYQLTWNDYGDEKGFYVLDTDTGEHEFISLKQFELYNKIKIDSETLPDKIENKFIQIELTCERTKKIDAYINSLAETNFDVSVNDTYTLLKEVGKDVEVKNFEMCEIVQDFLNEQNFTDEDKTAITSLFSNLYSKATMEE
jgi:DNA repair exonuclease SbcCD nuclease subunit